MVIHRNTQQPGETNLNDAQNDQHGTAPEQINILPVSQDDH